MLSITGLFFTMVFTLNDAIKIKYKGNVGKYLELLFSDLFIFCPFGNIDNKVCLLIYYAYIM